MKIEHLQTKAYLGRAAAIHLDNPDTDCFILAGSDTELISICKRLGLEISATLCKDAMLTTPFRQKQDS